LQCNKLTEVSFHAQRLVLLELPNGTAKQRNDGALHGTQHHSHQANVVQNYHNTIEVSAIYQQYKKGKGFPYSLPSVRPGANRCVQVVSPQVTHSSTRQ